MPKHQQLVLNNPTSSSVNIPIRMHQCVPFTIVLEKILTFYVLEVQYQTIRSREDISKTKT